MMTVWWPWMPTTMPGSRTQPQTYQRKSERHHQRDDSEPKRGSGGDSKSRRRKNPEHQPAPADHFRPAKAEQPELIEGAERRVDGCVLHGLSLGCRSDRAL
jgi:hypothetical protein